MVFTGTLLLWVFPLPGQQLQLQRNEATVLVEPYATNIVRISLSLRSADALAGPGYGLVAKPSGAGWTVDSDMHGDALRSDGLVVTVSPQHVRQPGIGTQGDID
jgi:alpha-D-xyloside xylohydrolase